LTVPAGCLWVRQCLEIGKVAKIGISPLSLYSKFIKKYDIDAGGTVVIAVDEV